MKKQIGASVLSFEEMIKAEILIEAPKSSEEIELVSCAFLPMDEKSNCVDDDQSE